MRSALLGLVGDARVRDGRRITFSELGPRSGFPVLYLHGAIGSPRWRTPELEAVIAEHRIRYVVVNRPGFAGSDPHPGRTVADFAFDVRDLADCLAYERFSVLGVSAGAPYALACAWAMPERVAAVTAVSPVVPASGAGASSGLRYSAPRLAFGAPGIGPLAAGASLRLLGVGSGTNPAAMIADYEVCRRPWGFDLREVPGPVIVVHGARDRLVPLGHARRLSAALPDSVIQAVPQAGHFFLSSLVREVVAPLTGALRDADPSARSLAA